MKKTKSKAELLVHEKHELIRQYDRKEIDEKTFKERFKEVKEKIDELIRIDLEERNDRGI